MLVLECLDLMNTLLFPQFCVNFSTNEWSVLYETHKESNVSSSRLTVEWQTTSYSFDKWTWETRNLQNVKLKRNVQQRQLKNEKGNKCLAILQWIFRLMCWYIFNADVKEKNVEFFNRYYKTYNASTKLLEGIVTKSVGACVLPDTNSWMIT